MLIIAEHLIPSLAGWLTIVPTPSTDPVAFTNNRFKDEDKKKGKAGFKGI